MLYSSPNSRPARTWASLDRRDSTPRLPLTIFLDVLALVLGVLTGTVALTGGWRFVALGVTVSVTSTWRLAAWTLAVLVVRHVVSPAPPLQHRLKRAFQALPQLARVLQRVTPPESAIWRGIRGWPWRRIALTAAYSGAIVLFLHSFERYFDRTTGLTFLTEFGDQFAAQQLPAVRDAPHYVHERSSGYDGQFYAQLAVAPLLRDPALADALDAPSYRARRILFSWTAWILGAGQPAWILQAYAAQNLASWLLLAWLLRRWFPPGDVRAFGAWFACLFSHGLIISARLALLEGPSMVLIVLAVMAIENRRTWLPSVILGISGLGRETNLLAAAMVSPGNSRGFARIARLVVCSIVILLPTLVWISYVRRHLGTSGVGLGNLDLPLSAYVGKWQLTIAELNERGWSWFAHFSLYALISLTVNALFLVWRVNWRSPWWRVGAAYAALLFVLGPPVWEGYPGAATRVLLPLTFAFNVLLIGETWYWPLFLLGNLTVLHGLQVLDVPWVAAYL